MNKEEIEKRVISIVAETLNWDASNINGKSMLPGPREMLFFGILAGLRRVFSVEFENREITKLKTITNTTELIYFKLTAKQRFQSIQYGRFGQSARFKPGST